MLVIGRLFPEAREAAPLLISIKVTFVNCDRVLPPHQVLLSLGSLNTVLRYSFDLQLSYLPRGRLDFLIVIVFQNRVASLTTGFWGSSVG